MNIFIPLFEGSNVMKLAKEIAKGLLEIEAVKVNTKQPFTWTSGLKSPVYCDNRTTLSFPNLRSLIIEGFKECVTTKYPDAEYIAGIATAGIAQGAILADKMNLPYCYIRPEPKKHGMKNQIEGRLEKGVKVVLIEDLISTGMSSLKAVEACREYGVEVLGVISIFSYGFSISKDAFANANCEATSLCSFSDLNEQAVKMKYISESETATLNEWQNDPKLWSEKHG